MVPQAYMGVMGRACLPTVSNRNRCSGLLVCRFYLIDQLVLTDREMLTWRYTFLGRLARRFTDHQVKSV